jgi:hypothetical protein
MSEICQICNIEFESVPTNICNTDCGHKFHTNCLLLHAYNNSTKHSVQCPYPECEENILQSDETDDESKSETDYGEMPALVDYH